MELNPFMTATNNIHMHRLTPLPPWNLSIQSIKYIVLNLAQEWWSEISLEEIY